MSDVWALFSAIIGTYIAFISRKKLINFEIYALLIMIYLPLSSAITSGIIFDQPIIYGLLCQRSFLSIGFSIYVLNCLKTGSLTATDLHHAFLKLSWVFLILNSVANLLIDPTKLASSDGFIDEADPRLMLDVSFVIYGFFYYGLSGMLKGRTRHLLYSLLFIGSYVIFSGGRFGLISMIVAFLLCCLKWQNAKESGIFFAKLISITVIAWFSFWTIAPEKLNELSYKFGEAFAVLATGQQGFDDSANSRIIQAEIATPFIEDNPLFGNGFLSAQWNDGFKGFFGYFHPSDNGFAGVVYVYGFVGLALILLQYWYSYLANRSGKKLSEMEDDFSRALNCFLVFTFIYSFTTGKMAFSIEQSIFMTAILFGINMSVSLKTPTLPVKFV